MIDSREGLINKTHSLPQLYHQAAYVLVSVLHNQSCMCAYTHMHTHTHTHTPLKALLGKFLYHVQNKVINA